MYDYQLPDAALSGWLLLARTWSAMYKAEERKLAKVGLSPEQLDVLWLSRDYPIPLTPAEISRSVFRENQTIAGLLSRMEREGLVRRVPKRKGKPFTEVRVTAKGEELCGRGIDVATSLVTRLMSALSAEELEQLQNLLRKLREKALDELHIELLPPPSYTGGQVEYMER